jgi:2-iminobutanoate/2-iminopropanoate deaminase
VSSTIERKPGPGGASFSGSVGVRGDGELVHVSGVIGAGDTLAEQAHGCFDQIADALAAHAATLSDVVRITTYLTSLDDYADFSAARAERFAGELPASTVVQVAGLLANGLIEIDAVAFVPAS